MTVHSEIDEEPRTPGQYAEGGQSELYGNIAAARREAEAKMAADPTYFPTVTGSGWLSPSDIDDLYGMFPRPRPYDPEYAERTAAQAEANAEFSADWEREHSNAVDGPTGAPDFDKAMVSADAGDVEAFYEAGVLHRTDGPAIVYPGGGEEWYLAGVLHRDDGPAVTTVDGSRYWYRGGDLHRDGGPAVEESDGTRAYYQNGKLHRTDGPAVEGPFVSARWYLDGKRQSAHSHKFQARAAAAPRWSTMPPPPVPDYSPDFDLESQYEDRSMEPEL